MYKPQLFEGFKNRTKIFKKSDVTTIWYFRKSSKILGQNIVEIFKNFSAF